MELRELENKKKELIENLEILKRDFANGAWNLPYSQVPERQAQVRAIKFEMQAAEEAYMSQHGTPTQQRLYTPLVRRRLLKASQHSSWSKLAADGTQFTFKPAEKVTHTVEGCGCGYNDPTIRTLRELKLHEAECKVKITFSDEQEVYQAKHTVGSWFCKACLESGAMQIPGVNIEGEDRPVLGWETVNPAKMIRWCPKFLSELWQLSPQDYVRQMQQHRPGKTICYAGLFHSQFNIVTGEGAENDVAEMVWKCDTCGFTTVEKKEIAKPVGQGEVLFSTGE